MLTKKEEALHKGLMKILDEATFPLKAREVAAFSEIVSWAKDLPSILKNRQLEIGKKAIDAKEQADLAEKKEKRRQAALKRKEKQKGKK